MFRNSEVYAQFEIGTFGEYVLIGDSGYANSPFLATPLSRRERANDADFSPADHEYQRAILSTRNTIERAFGVLKRRFPILHSGMQLRRIQLVQLVTTVCAMLHNICIDTGDLNIQDFPELPEEPLMDVPVEPNDANDAGGRRRRPVQNAREAILAIYEQRIARGVRLPNAEERLRRQAENHVARARHRAEQ